MKALSEATKIMPCLFLVGLLLGGGAVAQGQTVPDGFDPNANDRVYVVVVQPDGKILIGGNFTTLKPNGGPTVIRNRIARLNPDGSVDAAFGPSASDTVFSIAVQADGKILVGGQFTNVSTVTCNRIARLKPDGTLDTAFNPNSNGVVRSIVVQADGKILVGGQFAGSNSIGGYTRNGIARLHPTGWPDSFDPNANNYVWAIAVQADGKILMGGDFTTLAPYGRGAVVPRNRIARQPKCDC